MQAVGVIYSNIFHIVINTFQWFTEELVRILLKGFISLSETEQIVNIYKVASFAHNPIALMTQYYISTRISQNNLKSNLYT